MDAHDTAQKAGQGAADLVRVYLRTEFPYLKTAALEKLAQTCSSTVKDCIQEQTSIMTESKAHISFMSLSAELRNHIYELVVTPDRAGEGGVDGELAICVQDVRFEMDDSMTTWADSYGWTGSWRKQPAITRVSRQVRDESLPIYYGVNNFVAHPIPGCRRKSQLHQARVWLRKIGVANARRIKRFGIYCPHGLLMKRDVMMQQLNPRLVGLAESSVTLYREEDELEWIEVEEDVEEEQLLSCY